MKILPIEVTISEARAIRIAVLKVITTIFQCAMCHGFDPRLGQKCVNPRIVPSLDVNVNVIRMFV